MEDTEEFSDPQYLTAQVKLCRIKYQIIRTVSELRFGNAVEAQALIGPCLQALNRWSLEFSPPKFGFWESLHIFSSLTVHVISGCLMEKRPNAFAGARTSALYSPVRSLLGEMARLGNAASKDHEKMIHDIEDLFTDITPNTDLTEGVEDVVEWPEYLNAENMTFALDETLPPFSWS
ncbi:hypothetical protein APSETT444_002731 [Aspergillus pseudonomiae]